MIDIMENLKSHIGIKILIMPLMQLILSEFQVNDCKVCEKLNRSTSLPL